MSISVIDTERGQAIALQVLGLNPDQYQLFSVEGFAASLRRAASFLCPTTPQQIVDAVLEALNPLRNLDELTRDEVNRTLDLLISAGDLIELPRDETPGSRLLYLGLPTYVEKWEGLYLITGIRPYGAPILEGGALNRIDCEGAVRTIGVDPGEAKNFFRSAGLRKVTQAQWVDEPQALTEQQLITDIERRLDAANRGGVVDGLLVIDSQVKTTFYLKRLRSVSTTDAGIYVGRRPQEFGNPLWCAVRIGEVREGSDIHIERLLDFPVYDPKAPGSDEGLRLQFALDSASNNPQKLRYRAVEADAGLYTVDFFSPIPSWAQRYLNLVGVPAAQKTPGALFSFRVKDSSLPGLIDFMKRNLWMDAIPIGGVS